MRATDILENEHRVIEQVLNCLEVMANHALAEGKLDVISADAALEFFQVFADGCHHHKEENYLFPLMEAMGFPRDGGPTGVMLHEHQEGRTEIQAMQKALKESNVKDFARHARAYVELLRNHIFKEDHRLFPMANEALAVKDQIGLMNCFVQVEKRDGEAGTQEKYLDIADMLAERFQVPRVFRSGSSCGHS